MDNYTFKSECYYDDEPGGDDVTAYYIYKDNALIWEYWLDYHEYFEDGPRIDKEIRAELKELGLDMGHSELAEECHKK